MQTPEQLNSTSPLFWFRVVSRSDPGLWADPVPGCEQIRSRVVSRSGSGSSGFVAGLLSTRIEPRCAHGFVKWEGGIEDGNRIVYGEAYIYSVAFALCLLWACMLCLFVHVYAYVPWIFTDIISQLTPPPVVVVIGRIFVTINQLYY